MAKEVPTFVKWAGGKKQLLEQFKNYFPGRIEKYVEPFVGGGAILFYVIKKYNPQEVFIWDINEELINTYNIIKKDVESLITELKELKKIHDKEVFYKLRKEEPKSLSPLKRAARFIYLNKTCFNGLYRVNSKGGFNVPMGSYKNPLICPEEDLREISKLLKNVKIFLGDFGECSKLVDKDTFVYFDPPYYPLKKESFTTYSKEQFLEKEQIKLADLFNELNSKRAKLMLSNSDTKFIKELYKEYNIHFVQANRMINCDGKNRGKVSEVVITNYPKNK